MELAGLKIETWFGPIIAICGIVIGAVLNNLFSRSRDRDAESTRKQASLIAELITRLNELEDSQVITREDVAGLRGILSVLLGEKLPTIPRRRKSS